MRCAHCALGSAPLLLLLSLAVAAPTAAQQAACVVGPRDTAAMTQLVTEVERTGLVVSVHAARDPRSEEGRAAVLVLDAETCRVDVLVRARSGRDLVLVESVSVPPCEGTDARWLALRAAETLRAHLLEVAPRAADTAPQTAEPGERRDDVAAREQRSELALEVGLGALFSTGGPAPVALVSAAAEWRFARDFALALQVLAPWIGGEVRGDEGTAMVRPFSASISIGWLVIELRPLEVSISIGLSGMLIDIDATAVAPYEVRRELGLGWGPMAELDLQVELDPRIAIVASGGATVCPIPMELIFAGRAVAELGPLFVAATLGLRWLA